MRITTLCVLVLGLGGCASLASGPVETIPSLASVPPGSIAGVVVDSTNGSRVADAMVILTSSALPNRSLETWTNEQGSYAFVELPAGTYTIQVLYGTADVSKVATLPERARFRANFVIDPEATFVCRWPTMPRVLSASTSSSTLIGVAPRSVDRMGSIVTARAREGHAEAGLC